MEFTYKLGFIGFGNMANAVYNGIVDKIIKKSDIILYDIDSEKLKNAQDKGLSVAASNQEIFDLCEYIVLAVKPQQAANIFSSINGKKNTLISIMAGVTKKVISKFLPNCKVVRCMPNSPALIGKGITAIDCFDLDKNKRDFVLNLFSAVGETVELKEALMDAVTSISGSGPAYIYLFLDALIKAGMENGLDYKTSKKLSIQTLIGSAEMVKQTDTPIENLIEAVCSKGGTTIEAVKVFKDKNFEEIINDSVRACYNRAKELSK